MLVFYNVLISSQEDVEFATPQLGDKRATHGRGALNRKKIQIYITPGKEACIVSHYSWLNGAQTHDQGLTHTQLSYTDPLSRRKVLGKIAHVWVLFRLLWKGFPTADQGRAGRKKEIMVTPR